MANLLACSEEMMEESPDVDSEIAERIREKRLLSAQLDFSRVQPQLAFTDPTIVDDPRVFESMLRMEERQVSVPNYFKILQDDITPSMRNAITLWMFEVCEEESMEEPVFLRSVQYMDNFLAMQKINRTQFQLLGAVCLLISSKITGSTISPQRLSYYTANSVTPDLLLHWETMILGMLKWDVYGLVSSDFVQHILHRLPKNLWDNEAVTERIKTLTAYCATDHNFGIHLPSIIASASIAAALAPHIGQKSLEEVLITINLATNIEMDLLRACIDQIRLKVQLTVEENSKAPGNNACPGSTANCASMSNSSKSTMTTTMTEEAAMEEDKLSELSHQAGTPTDVADIHF